MQLSKHNMEEEVHLVTNVWGEIYQLTECGKRNIRELNVGREYEREQLKM